MKDPIPKPKVTDAEVNSGKLDNQQTTKVDLPESQKDGDIPHVAKERSTDNAIKLGPSNSPAAELESSGIITSNAKQENNKKEQHQVQQKLEHENIHGKK